MADQLTATVVGGGIAGLAAAVALAQAGWHAVVLERAPAFGEVGAGLGVTGNGMTALDVIGAGAAVRSVGHQVFHAGFQDTGGRWLLRMPDRTDLRALTTFWGLHRQRLHAAVLTAAERTEGLELVTAATVTSVRPGAPGWAPATVTWRADDTGEHTSESDLVVAADGVWSTVRTQLFPDAHPRYAGSTSWRAVIADTERDDRYVEVLGPGASFGSLRVSDTEVYWWGDFLHSESVPIDDELAAARDLFSDWPPQVRPPCRRPLATS